MLFTTATIIGFAQKAIASIKDGREMLTKVTDAVRDGRVALDTESQSELNRLLAEEQKETEAANNSLARAIEVARNK